MPEELRMGKTELQRVLLIHLLNYKQCHRDTFVHSCMVMEFGGYRESQGLETFFNMNKYTELLTFLIKIRISEYKHIQGQEFHGGQFAY